MKVNTIPPKPQEVDGLDDCLRLRIRNGEDNLNKFHPAGVLAENIGSNDGLVLILRQIYDDFKKREEDDKRIQVLLVDVNIYKRIMKVCNESHHVTSMLISG